MDTRRTAFLALAAILVAASCSDHPTAPQSASSPTPRADKGGVQNRTALVTNLPVTGTVAGGGAFNGTFTITRIAVDPATRALTVTGVLNGTANAATGVVQVVNQTVSTDALIMRAGDVAATGTGSSLFRPAAMASCGILNLVLGPLHLDLLGLVVDLNQVVLNVAAQSGTGNLLGNLLCTLTGLLDVPGAIAGILQIVDNINNILSGLGGLGLSTPAAMPFIPMTNTPVIRSA